MSYVLEIRFALVQNNEGSGHSNSNCAEKNKTPKTPWRGVEPRSRAAGRVDRRVY
jgi:hypothetical protein